MKQYISVSAIFDEDGNLLPVSVIWSDGRRFPIDRVTDVRYAASLKAGGAGIRYTCMIGGKEKYLFLEDNRWFIEQRNITSNPRR